MALASRIARLEARRESPSVPPMTDEELAREMDEIRRITTLADPADRVLIAEAEVLWARIQARTE